MRFCQVLKLPRVSFLIGLDIKIFTRGFFRLLSHQARPQEASSREVVLWLAVRHPQKVALELLAREIAPAGTGMAPGLTGMVGGRPKVRRRGVPEV